MDISELQLKINKNQAVNDLKAVEGQLNKTGEAADGLIDTLKNIGLTVGFGKLLKDSMELNNQFKGLETRFSSIFKGGIDTQVFSNLKTELGLSDTALKNILSTTGQFAKGLGQSSQYVKNFSADLTKAAADYSAYLGKTSASDISDTARKFAKASLGEVGELKEIGIIVDASSEQFKKAVKNIQEATGATEAQAKQMEIQKQIIEQVRQVAEGTASSMIDGWTELTKLFDQFKEILAGVGNIFSTVFGPILSTLNGILEIPFVKSTAAWVIAIGGVIIGYTSLMSVLNKMSPVVSNLKSLMSLTPSELEKIKNLEASALPILKKQLELKKQIANISGTGDGGGKGLMTTMLQYKQTTINLEPLKKELQGLGTSALSVIPAIQGISPEFSALSQSILNAQGIVKMSTAVTIGAAIAERVLAIARMNLANGTSVLTALFGNLGKVFKTLSLGAASFWKTLTGGAAGLAGLKAGFVALGAALGKLLIVLAAVVVVFDGIRMIINLISGKEWNTGTITRWFAEWIYGIDELEKKSKELDEISRRMYGNLMKVEELRKELQDMQLDRVISQMLPGDAIAALQQKNQAIRGEIRTLTWAVANFGDAVKRGIVEIPAGKTADEVRVETQQKLNNLTRELWNSEDKLAEKTKELTSLNWKFFDELDKLNSVFYRLRETFSFGYKDGKFQDLSKDYKYQEDAFRIGDLTRYLNQLGGATDLTSLERSKKYLTEIFSLTRDRFKYEVDQLMAQRDAMINNLKAMANIVKEASGFRSSAQASVEANSMEALQLASRRLEGLRGSELSPMIEQQRQVKEIERQVLMKQNQAVTVLEKINNQLYSVVNKIGTGSGASGEAINAVNPL